MKCTQCGAPIEAGAYKCNYCDEPIRSAPPPSAPAGQTGVAPGGGVPKETALRVRGLSADGCWYTCNLVGRLHDGVKVKWDDGRESVLAPEMVREPCNGVGLTPGARVWGEYEGKYYPGTVKQVGDGQWNVEFDDGETAMMPADRLCVVQGTLPAVAPGQMCLAQGSDGAWYPARVLSGPDGQGRQRVNLEQGGAAVVTIAQINGPAGPELLTKGKRVMGIGEDGYFYPATVMETKQGQAYLKFDDGDEAWLFAHQVRFVC